MPKHRIACIVGARPNFVKLAALYPALKAEPKLDPYIVHTGQHYTNSLNDDLFQDLGIPDPLHRLAIGSGSHAEQTAKAIAGIGGILEASRPDTVVVVGDTNSTLAGALAAAKLHIPVAHVEAGLRSHDRRMAEEINRIVTDAVSDQLFVTEWAGAENLLREGKQPRQIFEVGNVMADTLLRFLPRARQAVNLAEMGVEPKKYALLTLHRAELVDGADALKTVLGRMAHIAQLLPVVFPIHPRTRKTIHADGGEKLLKFFQCSPPLGYLEFIALLDSAAFVVTDSGGIQEEATVLGVPCLTVRNNTERPVTVEEGTNTIVGEHGERLIEEADKILGGEAKRGTVPKLWDGKASRRIAKILAERLGAKR